MLGIRFRKRCKHSCGIFQSEWALDLRVHFLNSRPGVVAFGGMFFVPEGVVGEAELRAFFGESELAGGLIGECVANCGTFIISAEGEAKERAGSVLELDGQFAVIIGDNFSLTEFIRPLSVMRGGGGGGDLEAGGEGGLESEGGIENDGLAGVGDAISGDAAVLEAEINDDFAVG